MNFTCEADASSKAEFLNCLYSGDSYGTKINRSSFVNCILKSGSTNNDMFGIPSETMAMNCLAIGSESFFNDVPSAIDCSAVNLYGQAIPTIFKEYTSFTDRWGSTWYSLTSPFELTDEAKAKYLGTDGKEIGLYGGQYPYDFTPNYPRITKLNVAKQTTADNKLSVDIEVSAAE